MVKKYARYLYRAASGNASEWLKGEDGPWVLEFDHPMGYTNREASAIADHTERHNPTAQQTADLPERYEFLGMVNVDPEKGGWGRADSLPPKLAELG